MSFITHTLNSAVDFLTLINGLRRSNSNFSAAKFGDKEINFSGTILNHENFKGIDIKRCNVLHADFTNASCVNTILANCNLRDCSFNQLLSVDSMDLSGSLLSREILSTFIPFLQWWNTDSGKPSVKFEKASFKEEDLSSMNSHLYGER